MKLYIYYDEKFLTQNKPFIEAFRRVVLEPFEIDGFFDSHGFKEKIDKDIVIETGTKPKDLIVKSTCEDYQLVHYTIKHSCTADKRIELLKRLIQHFTKKNYVFGYTSSVLYNKDRILVKTVDTVVQYMELIETIKHQDNDQNGKNYYFYRGVSNLRYPIYPSLYRNQGHIDHENSIYKSALQQFPKEFTKCISHFDKLVQMQHYTLYTRLLDITTNPLVALFFACKTTDSISWPKEPFGRVTIYQMKQAPKFFDSDTVSILSSYGFLEEEIRKTLRKVSSTMSIEAFNDMDEAKKLLHEIQYEKAGFLGKINPTDLKQVLPVYAIMNNDRIIKQSGLFLLAGLYENNVELQKAIIDLHVRRDDKEFLIIIKNKKEILNQLKSYHMTKADLFPNLEDAAQDILDKYKK